MRTLEEHSEPVTALAWLPDGSGFISGSLDRKINQWVSLLFSACTHRHSTALQDADGKLKESWGTTAIRVTDLAITPDFTRLVTIGMHHQLLSDLSPPARTPPGDHQPYAGGAAASPAASITPANKNTNNRLIIYGLASKQVIS